MSAGQPIVTGYEPRIPTAGAVQWDGPLSALLQALIDSEEARVAASGMDIQATLTLNGNALSDVLSLRFSTATTDPGLPGTAYVSGTDLYFRDGANQKIQFTAGGFLNVQGSGSIGGDYPTSAASAIYTNSVASFRFYSSPGVYSTMENGQVRIHNANSTGYIGLAAPAGQSNNITYTLPGAYPGARKILETAMDGTLSWTDSPLLSGTVAAGGTYDVTGRLRVSSDVITSGSIYLSTNHDLILSGSGKVSLGNGKLNHGLKMLSVPHEYLIFGAGGTWSLSTADSLTGFSAGTFDTGGGYGYIDVQALKPGDRVQFILLTYTSSATPPSIAGYRGTWNGGFAWSSTAGTATGTSPKYLIYTVDSPVAIGTFSPGGGIPSTSERLRLRIGATVNSTVIYGITLFYDSIDTPTYTT